MSTITSEADKNCVTLPKHLDKCLIQPRSNEPVGWVWTFLYLEDGNQAFHSEVFIVTRHT